jgi:hypothetical protein
MPAHSSSIVRRRLGAIALFGLAVLLGSQLPGLIRPPESDLGDADSSPPKRERKILSALTTSMPMPAVGDDLLAADRDADDPDGMNIVEAILSDSELSTSQKAQALLAAIDHLSGAPAIAACEQALLRLKSESYEAAFAKLVSDGVEMGVRQSIMADLMDRSDFLRLPLLVRLASLSQQPFHEEARVELIAVLGDDYGTNWLGWSDGVASYLESVSGVTGVDFQQ